MPRALTRGFALNNLFYCHYMFRAKNGVVQLRSVLSGGGLHVAAQPPVSEVIYYYYSVFRAKDGVVQLRSVLSDGGLHVAAQPPVSYVIYYCYYMFRAKDRVVQLRSVSSGGGASRGCPPSSVLSHLLLLFCVQG